VQWTSPAAMAKLPSANSNTERRTTGVTPPCRMSFGAQRSKAAVSTDADEVLKDRLNELKADRDRAKAALERAKEHSAPQGHIDPALIERFGHTLCENFRNGSVPFRKAYLQSLIDVVEIDDRQIRIKGRKELLEKAVLASQSGQPECSQTSTRWRARRDSNS
jgi:site-specific DNA recombinase